MSSRTVAGAFPDPYLHPTLSVALAGALLGLGRTQAYAAVRRGDIPSVRIGRRVLVPTGLLGHQLGLFGSEGPRPTAPRAAGGGA